MQNCAILFEDGVITDVFSEKRFTQKKFAADVRIIDVNGAFIAPGFIDTHIHGFAGFGTEDASVDSILEMSRELSQYGVTAFVPTLYPSSEESMIRAIEAVVCAMGKEDGATIMGLHLEGPFISPRKLGVQKSDTLKPVDIPLMERLWNAARGNIVNMTVAPELKGMHELALYCLKKEIVLQAGHTDAEYEHMVEGMRAGILHATHMFNAMSRMNHRNPNAAGAVLIHSEMSCEIIADGVHVHPDMIKLLMRDKPIDKLVLITDALKPTEQRGGALFANGEEVVFRDGCFHRKSDDVIAGSALTMIGGVKNLVEFGFAPPDAVRLAATNPAQVMKFTRKGLLIPGYDADIVVFDKEYNVLLSGVGGAIKRNEF